MIKVRKLGTVTLGNDEELQLLSPVLHCLVSFPGPQNGSTWVHFMSTAYLADYKGEAELLRR